MVIYVNQYEMKLLSSLAKVFPDTEPRLMIECNRLTALKCETESFQIAYIGPNTVREIVTVDVSSPIRDLIRVRSVGLVPASYPAHKVVDDNYLRTAPGLFPDTLNDLEDGRVYMVAGQWRALWVDVTSDESTVSGCYPIELSLINEYGEKLCGVRTQVKIIDACLPEQELIHTHWFHSDCLSDYYHDGTGFSGHSFTNLKSQVFCTGVTTFIIPNSSAEANTPL